MAVVVLLFTATKALIVSIFDVLSDARELRMHIEQNYTCSTSCSE